MSILERGGSPRPTPTASILRHSVPIAAIPAVPSTRPYVRPPARWLPIGAPLGARSLLGLASAGYHVVEAAEVFCAQFRRPYTHVVATPDGRTYLAIVRR